MMMPLVVFSKSPVYCSQLAGSPCQDSISVCQPVAILNFWLIHEVLTIVSQTGETFQSLFSVSSTFLLSSVPVSLKFGKMFLCVSVSLQSALRVGISGIWSSMGLRKQIPICGKQLASGKQLFDTKSESLSLLEMPPAPPRTCVCICDYMCMNICRKVSWPLIITFPAERTIGKTRDSTAR